MEDSAAAWTRLLEGRPIGGLGLERLEGRAILSGFELEEPKPDPARGFDQYEVRTFQRLTRVTGARWQDLLFESCRLPSLRLMETSWVNLVFRKCVLDSSRAWALTVDGCRFEKTSIRNAGLGGELAGRRNLFRNCVFDACDFRGTAFLGAIFENCTFNKCKLEKVSFGNSSFRECVFRGRLEETEFYGAFDGRFSVDLKEADLRFVDIRHQKLDEVRFPADDRHIVLRNFRDTVKRAILAFSGRQAPWAADVVSFLEIILNTSSPGPGVISRFDVLEASSEVGWEELRRFCLGVEGHH